MISYSETVSEFSIANISDYPLFVNEMLEDEELCVEIKIKKEAKNGILSVYDLALFSDFLCKQQKIEKLLGAFTILFEKCGDFILLQTLNCPGVLQSNSIGFSDHFVSWENEQDRKLQLEKCDDACVFLDRNRIRLIPQDFDIKINSATVSDFDVIKDLFNKLKTILSYIYIANTATIKDDIAVVHFEPTSVGYKFELEKLSYNKVVSVIYNWIFENNESVEKACIARRIINIYCRNETSILEIDENVLNSIKSDYVIYQKNHAEQYIDMKNKISEFIIDCAGKIQELSYDISNALKNNFIAVIVFFMTVFLTDSIDISQFINDGFPPKLTLAFLFIIVLTVFNWVATIVMGCKRWKWVEQSYLNLRKNYEDVFEYNDLETAFNHDEALENARKQYIWIRNKFSGMWIAFILVLVIFAILF